MHASPRRSALAAAILAAPGVVAAVWTGTPTGDGPIVFGAGQLALFGLLSLLAAIAAFAIPGSGRPDLPRPALVVASVGAIAVLSALSAAWTRGAAVDALGSGALAGGYLALLLAAAGIARRGGTRGLADTVTAVAVGLSTVGIIAVALGDSHLSRSADGSLRPQATLGYAPALAFLAVSALPWAMALAVSRKRGPRVARGLPLAVLAATLGLSESRWQQAVAAIVVLVAIGLPRVRAAAVAAVLTAIAARVLLIGGVPVLGGGRAGSLATLAAILAGGTIVSTRAFRRPAGVRRSPPARRWRASRAARIAVVLLAAASAVSLGGLPGVRRMTVDEFSHGRVSLWKAAAHAIADRPLQGSGAGGYLQATTAYQTVDGRPALPYAHDLVLDLAVTLGVAGGVLALGVMAGTLGLAWRARRRAEGLLFAPAAVGFVGTVVLDWQWYMPVSGWVWAIATGALLGAASSRWSGGSWATAPASGRRSGERAQLSSASMPCSKVTKGFASPDASSRIRHVSRLARMFRTARCGSASGGAERCRD